MNVIDMSKNLCAKYLRYNITIIQGKRGWLRIIKYDVSNPLPPPLSISTHYYTAHGDARRRAKFLQGMRNNGMKPFRDVCVHCLHMYMSYPITSLMYLRHVLKSSRSS